MTKTSKAKRKLSTSKSTRNTGQPQQINIPDNVEKTTKTWKLILAGCSLIGVGFAAGIYVGNNNSRIEYQDKINDYRERIIENEKLHEKEIHDYNHELSEIRNENNELRQQYRELKTKKKQPE